jgi:hypothetical protein
VDHHAGPLVDHQQSLVFIDDVDRNVFSGDGPFLHPRDIDADDFTRLGPIAGFLAPAVDEDVSLGDQSGRLGPRELGALGNKQIEADITVRLDGKFSRLGQA